MKNNCFLFSFLLILVYSGNMFAQGEGEWTWMKGDNIPSSLGNFGTKGVPVPTNKPPGLYEAFEWTDLDGNFWIFGGYGFDGNHNALWKFDPVTNLWTWIHGSSTTESPGIYGTLGIPSPTNTPGARAWGGISWIDGIGDLWLFGGLGYVNNDLWRYNIASNQWTWMKGSDYSTATTLVSGIQGVPDVANTPNWRQETNGGVSDGLGNLWLFGGWSEFGLENDVWKYNIATNMWTWVKGNHNPGDSPNYGTLNVSSPINDPGDRFCYTKFIDSENNLYFMGGSLSSFDNGRVSDVWKFNTQTAEWTWVGGTSVVDSQGSYINTCDTLTVNIPKAKYEIRASWADSCGFFFFGGFTDSPGDTSYNDLWYFNVETNQFTWISGTNIRNDPGNYGTIGVSASTNLPPSRGGAVGFKDQQGNLWLFGGWASDGATSFLGLYNDLWRYKLNPCCKLCSKSIYSQLPIAAFTKDTTCVDLPFTVQFTNNSSMASNYLWDFGDGSPPDTSANPTHIYLNEGTYIVSLTASDTNACGNSSVYTDTIFVLNSQINSFTITGYDGCFPYQVNAFTDNSSVNTYQWYVNGNLYSTNDSIILGPFTQNTSNQITLVTTNPMGCIDSSIVNQVFTDSNCTDLFIPNVFTPNDDGTNGFFTITAKNYKSYHIEIYNRWGNPMFESSNFNTHWNGKNYKSGLECSDGIYFYILKLIDKQDLEHTYQGFITVLQH